MSQRPLIIAPSLLACDFAQFGEEAARAERAGADWLHVDVMDGHFVPNLTFGPDVVAALKRSTKLPLDVHLMIERPDRYAEAFLKAGADVLTVHVEAPHDVAQTLRKIRGAGVKCGLAINPGTSLDAALPYLGLIDLLLCMTVHPGFGGQSFIEPVMEKTRRAAELREERALNFEIEVDGGVTQETALTSVRNGANALVAGTSLYRAVDMAAAVKQMRESCAVLR